MTINRFVLVLTIIYVASISTCESRRQAKTSTRQKDEPTGDQSEEKVKKVLTKLIMEQLPVDKKTLKTKNRISIDSLQQKDESENDDQEKNPPNSNRQNLNSKRTKNVDENDPQNINTRARISKTIPILDPQDAQAAILIPEKSYEKIEKKTSEQGATEKSPDLVFKHPNSANKRTKIDTEDKKPGEKTSPRLSIDITPIKLDAGAGMPLPMVRSGGQINSFVNRLTKKLKKGKEHLPISVPDLPSPDFDLENTPLGDMGNDFMGNLGNDLDDNLENDQNGNLGNNQKENFEDNPNGHVGNKPSQNGKLNINHDAGKLDINHDAGKLHIDQDARKLNINLDRNHNDNQHGNLENNQHGNVGNNQHENLRPNNQHKNLGNNHGNLGSTQHENLESNNQHGNVGNNQIANLENNQIENLKNNQNPNLENFENNQIANLENEQKKMIDDNQNANFGDGQNLKNDLNADITNNNDQPEYRKNLKKLLANKLKNQTTSSHKNTFRVANETAESSERITSSNHELSRQHPEYEHPKIYVQKLSPINGSSNTSKSAEGSYLQLISLLKSVLKHAGPCYKIVLPVPPPPAPPVAPEQRRKRMSREAPADLEGGPKKLRKWEGRLFNSMLDKEVDDFSIEH